MEIACLGWGSLIWDSGSLKTKSIWFEDGPKLPIEFARQSSDDRITLVIVRGKEIPWVQSLWALLDVKSMEGAIEMLRAREGIPKSNIDKHIGSCTSSDTVENDDEIAKSIQNWLVRNDNDLDGVVWTDLPPKFNGINNRIPSVGEVIKHIQSLEGERAERAKEYVQKAPPQIGTKYRKEIISRLNLSPPNPASS
jgi:hypothetical protein